MKVKILKGQGKKPGGKSPAAKRLRWILVLLVVAVGAAAAIVSFWGIPGISAGSNKKTAAFTVRRGDLTVSVTESGDIKALNSKDIKSEVEGRTTIISIVDEGIYITPEDVNNGKVLVELDSSDIQQKLTQQEISFLTAKAGYTEAKESLDIQKKQNDSDIKAGQMKVRFALIDLKKYLGEAVAEKIMPTAANHDLKQNEIALLVDDPNLSEDVAEKIMASAANHDLKQNEIALLVDAPNLGGEALQRLRELDAGIFLKEQQLELAKSRLEWTEKLYEKEYVSLNDKEADRLDKETKDIEFKKAGTAKDLFVKYEFPKQAEKLLSDYDEAGRELERIEARARSKLAQAQAKLDSNKATYLVRKQQLEKLQKQLDACVIKAPSPGQVVYSSSMMDRWSRQRGLIEVGAEVRERQKIISIPDLSEMKVEIKIHETWVDKIQIGQQVKITIAAFPDETFTGKVLKKAPLADPEEWLNPDLKVYSTDVSIEGTHDFIKTGMTAKVEVIIDQLKDVLNVPIQSVATQEGAKVCYVTTDAGLQKRQVETGLFNEDFVEIKSGLDEGEKVLLTPPRISESKPVEKKPKQG